jgi:putative ABC transport system ATP-binding protein
LTVPSIEIRDLHYHWPRQPHPSLVVDHFTLAEGERLLLQGPSGSGKSTLINLLAGVARPQRGELRLLGEAVTGWSGPRRDRFRADHIGLIFQQFNLLPYLSVLENVLLACDFSRRRRQRTGDPAAAARTLLEALGLVPALWSRPAGQLSVGQQQRVAVARALIGSPELIIADEPTSALDSDARDAFIELLLAQARESDSAVLCVSHDRSLAPHFDRTVEMAALNRAGAEAAA